MGYNKETGMYEGYIYKIYNDVNDKIYIGQTTATLKERWHGHMSSALCESRCKSALYNAMRKYGRDKFHIEEIDKLQYSTKEELIANLNKLEQQRIIDYKSLSHQNGYNFEKGGDNKTVPGRRVCKYDLDLNLLDTYISLQEAGRQNNIDGATIWAVCRHDFYTAGGYVWAYEGEEPVKPNYDKVHKRPKKEKIYVSKVVTPDIKKQRKIQMLGWYDGRRIFQYNSYGELINIFENPVDASEKLGTIPQEIRYNLEGKNLCFKKTVLRYEDEPFDKYSRSLYLQPVTIYDLQGNFISHFETRKDAEVFLGVPSGEITKVLKRGGSCKGYLIAPYGQPLERKLERWEKTVLMCDDDWNIVQEFSTKNSVAKYFGIADAHHSLNLAIENKTKYRGYYWMIKEEFALTA